MSPPYSSTTKSYSSFKIAPNPPFPEFCTSPAPGPNPTTHA
ncbi:hypothetical protein RSOL_142130 [Rhizoctonia solani AG-3 Rhs1AP]|uniref:Uncharacterized protein n=1 Tax=Rhizoctonia solani AG-3 Rhs1AP TaxID=1086054 RepID=X8J1Q9_9AGAM|nr:hypothetical protein RSOL_142130 [Rhizoctonia solani AG-3 Rhs1AP]